MECEVFVLGGGISGAAAAISAARMGCNTLIADKNGFLGGMLTAAGVGPMMTFHAGERQVIKGFPDELVERLKLKGKSPGHIIDTTGYTYTVTPFDMEGMKRELDLMAGESGLKVLFHSMLADVVQKRGQIEKVTIVTKGGPLEVKAKVYIDATGDADLSYMAGVPCNKGRVSDGKCQPMTLKMRVSNVDIEKIRKYYYNNPEKFPGMRLDADTVAKTPKLSLGGFAKELENARTEGRISFFREDILLFEGNNPGEVIINTTRIIDADGTDPWSISNAEMEGRKQAEELAALLKSEIPGFENSYVSFTGPNIGIRSSRQIQGVYELKVEDLLNGKKFDDVIAHSGYPVDIHAPDGFDSKSIHLKRGAYYSIPYRCLVNNRVGNIITVGRCISATFEAQGAIRTTPTAAAIGQAGGVAAAIFVTDHCKNAVDVDVKRLQKCLKLQGAYIKTDKGD